MKTSVVVTTYNGAAYLVPLLDSLRDQTREIDEVLIFDDRSTDGTEDILFSYIEANHLKNWKVTVNEKNLGWEQNFSQSMQAASGDVIFPCDQDDIWHKDKVGRMTAAFEENADILLLVSGFHEFSDHGSFPTRQHAVPTEGKSIVSKVAFRETYYQIRRPGCTMALKKDIMPLFMQNWKPGSPHDAVLWTIASLLGRLYLYDDTFIEYRRHDANASKKIDHEFRYKVDEVVRTKRINDWYLRSPYFDASKAKIVKTCSVWCVYRYRLLVRKQLHYWFLLFKYRHYYLTNKKYIGDLYYMMQGRKLR